MERGSREDEERPGNMIIEGDGTVLMCFLDGDEHNYST